MDQYPTRQVGFWTTATVSRRLYDSEMRLPFVRPAPGYAAQSRVVQLATGRKVGVYEYGDPNGRPVFALHGTPACGAGFDWTDGPRTRTRDPRDRTRSTGHRPLRSGSDGVGGRVPARARRARRRARDRPVRTDRLLGRRSVRARRRAPFRRARPTRWRSSPAPARSARGPRGRIWRAAIASSRGCHCTRPPSPASCFASPTSVLAPRRAPRCDRPPRRCRPATARCSPRSDRRVRRSHCSRKRSRTARTASSPTTRCSPVRGASPLGEITVPVHCWHGTDDTLVPLAHTEALMARLPDADAHDVAGRRPSRPHPPHRRSPRRRRTARVRRLH